MTEQALAPDAAAIATDLLALLEARTRTELGTDQELFASGLVSSMFAMELIVHLEKNYDIAITGPNLKLDNFRTVDRMTELVLRLRGEAADG